jgi:adenosylcobyric acid synthase
MTAAGRKKGVLIGGTGSNVGKSTLVAGALRWAKSQGIAAAPFKGQNMSLNSAVTPDGKEIARAQAVQAQAAGLEPEVDFNPVLLKPMATGSSQLIVSGKVAGELSASNWVEGKRGLIEVVIDAYHRVSSRYDLVIAEGAGSIAEINLRGSDLANMALAGRVGLPVVLVADLDPGGAFASIFGHYRILPEEESSLIKGFVINKVRGVPGLLQAGIEELCKRLGTVYFGSVPFFDPGLPSEDAFSRPKLSFNGNDDSLTVGIVALPHIANFSDFEPLMCETELNVFVSSAPGELVRADLLVIPGSKATVADLAWMRSQGIDEVVADMVRSKRWVMGICGGYQMLTRKIFDPIESRCGLVDGMGVFDATVNFQAEKIVDRVTVRVDGLELQGYRIHQGVVLSHEEPFGFLYGVTPEGSVNDRVIGTSVHGLFENDEFRSVWLAEVASTVGKKFVSKVRWQEYFDQRLDELAAVLGSHLDMAALLGI